MIFSYEILREAGIRLPRAVGQAVSIVGALIMGEAATSAGLVGAPVVITVALTAVSSFLVPMQNESASIIRILIMILSSILGLYGVAMGFLALLLYLGSLTSFGIDFFAGFAWTRNLQDSAVRMPLWTMVKRPANIARGDMTRRRFFVPPLRPYAAEEEDDSEGGEDVE
jgi:spore germination protein KA